MLIKTIISGFGGQGVIMMGYILAMGGMLEGKNVTCLPSYGAEVRGGTANCTVVISTEEIASPVASEPDYGIFMNKPSLMRFQNQIQSGGTIFINSSLIDTKPIRGDIESIEIPLNELAKKIPEVKNTNIIMLGAFIKKTLLVLPSTIINVIKDTFAGRNPNLFKLNRLAFQIGYEYLE